MKVELDLLVVGLITGIIFLLVIGVLLAVALIKLIRLLNRANRVLESNEKDISDFLAVLPETAENFNEACKKANETFDSVTALSDNVNNIVATASDAEEVVGSFANIVSWISHIINFISGLFKKDE